ncbi:PLD nuclease N-terminal domain-containing protein [Pseudomonas sp.]|uniref:PLD nuclease N-terminal domain-containing protein n=1 Tax=Pseudomonas sp. TaxID=306 RepID=UPI002583F0FC|nr:PLD nuclease N-terminal domain-containing protein [Pseudomonas sp.]
MDLTYVWIVLAVVVLLVDLLAIASIWRTTKSRGTKVGWVVLILALPLIGVAIWGVAGPRGIAEPPTSKEHSKG